MHSFARCKFESRKYRNRRIFCGLPEIRYAAHIVVVGDSEYGYFKFRCLLDNSFRMSTSIFSACSSTEFLLVTGRIHLQRTAMEYRSLW